MYLFENHEEEIMLDKYAWYLTDILLNYNYVPTKTVYKFGNIAILLKAAGINVEKDKSFLGSFNLIVTTDHEWIKSRSGFAETDDMLVGALSNKNTIWVYINGGSDYANMLDEPSHNYSVKLTYSNIKHELRHAYDYFLDVDMDDTGIDYTDQPAERRARYSQMLPELSEFVKKSINREQRGYDGYLSNQAVVDAKLTELFTSHQIKYDDDLYLQQRKDAVEYIKGEYNRLSTNNV